ncbi:non-canonical purine NTP diphosphatase [Carboxylicivirga linearis]|uniref:dITP/XTP pyrophosphatase n=1 Tax=Carboxylicivirga linearis TaxID=1628157 RepID=A0ABS5JRB0_9BACT|nr:non-canonical purine NTP diphosphatase [Carboxylicivirga linearis]MBS2096941.1 non-canonical purine NTP diphosphatase [Carboxylicivirga linearis]
MELVFATNNNNKLKEIQAAVGEKIQLKNLSDINCFDDIPETRETLEGNALQKAEYIYDKYSINCFADDTGLEIDALNGEPGVYSARYAGPQREAEDNMAKVLELMKSETNRKAKFRTVMALIIDDQKYLFEGVVEGQILTEKTGKDGFGYDPIFQPDGYSLSFAEMSLADKNKISHRAKAVYKLVEFLKKKQ